MAKTRSVSKAGRLLLYLCENLSYCDTVRQAEIPRWFGDNLSAVHKDVGAVDDVVAVSRELLAMQSNTATYDIMATS